MFSGLPATGRRPFVPQSFVDVWNRRIVEVREPKPGFRHQNYTKLVFHRFPVKGGLSLGDAIIWQQYQPNPMLKSLLDAATRE
jgi:hypothetical protein